ncbi:MAG: toll/interleukin-1 receptor domain-containing protein, partial [Pseudomonadota bacterium]
MARIFISHSSKNNLESLAFRDWLLTLGYAPDDVFLDLHSLGAGDRWREALRAANRRCEAVILLASPDALQSDEVRREVMLAEEYGKPLLVCLLEGLDLDDYSDARLTPYRDRQMVDLATAPKDVSFTVQHENVRDAVHFNGAALAKINGRLEELGLEAASFSWTPADPETANPYPGLRGFSEREAGLFFGRDPEISRGLSVRSVLRTERPREISGS